jgi:hypothetical protein
MVEHLPCKCEALSSSCSTEKKLNFGIKIKCSSGVILSSVDGSLERQVLGHMRETEGLSVVWSCGLPGSSAPQRSSGHSLGQGTKGLNQLAKGSDWKSGPASCRLVVGCTLLGAGLGECKTVWRPA